MRRGRGLLESGRILYLPTEQLRPNPSQPRKIFDSDGQQELAASIQNYGILQPLTVRRRNGEYELVAGERRLRAAKLAGLTEVPCILLTVDEQQSSMVALVENLQRRDLDYIEEAEGLARLMRQYGLNQEQAAARSARARARWQTSCACCATARRCWPRCAKTGFPSGTRGRCCAYRPSRSAWPRWR